MKIDFNDVLIVPRESSNINSRQELNPFHKSGYYPIITAPMDTVISPTNSDLFLKSNINICYPRNTTNLSYTKGLGPGLQFESISLTELQEVLEDKRQLQIVNLNNVAFVCVDIANGHMNSLHVKIKQLKEKFGSHVQIMTGNVANPKTYRKLSEAGADYIRIGIGNGNGCLTTQQTGVGYPMASLIRECFQESLYMNKYAKIVADGGMKDYSDITKALALGADYVMIGSIFNKALESCAKTYYNGELINQYLSQAKDLFLAGAPLKMKPFIKEFRGMSTKEVQKEWGNKNIKTSEGISETREVEYTLEQWINNFDHYLRTAMSYAGAMNLQEYIGLTETILISTNAYNRFNK